MADIKQAALWMKEEDETGGKMVRRASWPCMEYMLTLNEDGFIRDGYTDGSFDDAEPLKELTADDLLADDWEIARSAHDGR